MLCANASLRRWGAVSSFISWDELENAIRNCRRCSLHRSRRNAVPGEGSRESQVILIGEAPGSTEDEMGRPFVGAAGKLLTVIMESAGVPRWNVYITNVVKCRPPNNREPSDDEISLCSVYLEAQLRLLKPRAIVTLGNIAGRKIFSMGGMEWSGISRMRGRVYKMNILGLEAVVIPTLHPAAALYNPQLKKLLESDFELIKGVLDSFGGSISRPKTLFNYMKQQH
ncbi:MAG: type-4 uracil-DNA glycosylase [Ignisphaera sp.]|nr:type-4 uracil-DNA glycosylase [Ignisphaera sp.]MCX8168522.1 type-4 uracil-DNA glycosylase [Ignisphaera sp.]MDW8085039.1 type-4 uracil-DNA glycosylase [Ignisphaera sp.]